MAKRYTSTEKWNDPWFRKLKPFEKALWDYLCCSCDNAGVWQIDYEDASFRVSYTIATGSFDVFNEGKERVILSQCGHYVLIIGFINYQIGNMFSEKLTNLQKSCIILVYKHVTNKRFTKEQFGITGSLPVDYRYKHKDIEIYKHKNIKTQVPTDVQSVLDYFCTKLQKKLTLTPEREKIIHSRLKEGRTVQEMNMAIDNFAKDDWADRHKYCDIVYCIGTRNKVNNLDRWLNQDPRERKEKVMAGF